MDRYEEAYAAYTKRYTHSITVVEDGFVTLVTFQPQSVCNHRELDEIFDKYDLMVDITAAMRERVGTASKRGGHANALRSQSESAI